MTEAVATAYDAESTALLEASLSRQLQLPSEMAIAALWQEHEDTDSVQVEHVVAPWKDVRKALRGLSTTASRSYTHR